MGWAERQLGILVPPLPERHVLSGHTGTVTSVAFSPGGSTLASGSADKTVILWDLVNEKRGATLRGHSGRVSSLAFAPDGKSLATASDDGTVIIWDLATNRVCSTLRGHASPFTALAFSPDGMTLAIGSRDGRIKLWDVGTGRVRLTIEGGNGPVWELVFTPDGSTVAAGVFKKAVTLWDSATGKPKGTERGWHHSDTTAAALLVGRTTLALSQGRDGRIWLKDCNKGQILGFLGGHSGAVRCLAFDPGGTLLASGGTDKLVRLWKVTDEIDRWNRIEALLEERARKIARQNEAREEKRREEREDR
jgi:WD40 repeat protein